VNCKLLQRHMRKMGIAGITGIALGPNLSRRAAKAAVYRYLPRNLEITQVNQVWGVDITYIRMKRSGLAFMVCVRLGA